MEIDLTLGERIGDLRNSKGISQEDLAQIIGVKQPTISEYENGKSQPDYDNLIKIADYFNVSIDYILRRTNIKTNPSLYKTIATIKGEKFNLEKVCDILNGLDDENKAKAVDYINLLRKAKDK